MQQQSLELDNVELESLKKRVTDLEREFAVHQKECEMRDKNIQDKLNDISDKEAETKLEVINSREELKREINERFGAVNKKIWAGLAAFAMLSAAIASWSFTRLHDQPNSNYHSNHEIIRVHPLVYKI